MQRVGWSASTCLVLALCAAGARAQEFEVDGFEETGPRLSVEYGRSPTQVGFAVEIDGGVPFAHAQLTVKREGDVAEHRALVPLDENGSARIVERNAMYGVVLQVSCTIPAVIGGTVNSAAVRTAIVDLSMPQSPPLFASVGDIVICEIMKDPSFVTDANGEWFEVRNRSHQAIDLEGWKIADASTSHTIHGATGTMIIQPKAYFVFGVNSNAATNGGILVGYKYSSSFSLGNSADEIRLTDNNGVLIDMVAYDDGIFWPDDSGKSISLERGTLDPVINDDGANWCSALSQTSATNTDLATPRRANNTCP